jgi:hypothetical protein
VPTKSRGKPEAKDSKTGKLSRVVLDIPEARKRALKAKAATAGLTMKDYVLELLAKDGI